MLMYSWCNWVDSCLCLFYLLRDTPPAHQTGNSCLEIPVAMYLGPAATYIRPAVRYNKIWNLDVEISAATYLGPPATYLGPAVLKLELLDLEMPTAPNSGPGGVKTGEQIST